MSFAVVAVLLAAPVVKLGAGSGVIIAPGVMLTTSRVAHDTARAEGRLDDGGTVTLGQMLELEGGLTAVAFEGGGVPAELQTGTPDAGVRLRVVTGDAEYEATVVAVTAVALELAIADAGVVAGAPLVDAEDRVWGLVRDEHRAVTSQALLEVIDTIRNRQKAPESTRWRNLGISAAFFLGLTVWWVYRSKRRRY